MDAWKIAQLSYVRLATARPRASAALLLLACCAVAGCGQPGMPAVDFTERFDGNSANAIWQMTTIDSTLGTMEIVDDALVFTAPPAAEPRPQMRNAGMLQFDGDFEVSMDFELLTPLPEPEKDYANLELIVHGPAGTAHLSRVNHKGSGNGVVAYFSASGSGKDVWKHVPTNDASGTLRMVRVADNLDFLFVGASSAEPVTVASAPFGSGAVRGLSIALSVKTPTTAPLKVRVDNVAVHSRTGGGSMLTPVLVVVGVMAFLGIGIVGLWLRRRGGSAGGRQAAAE